jgi:hypothetical protein
LAIGDLGGEVDRVEVRTPPRAAGATHGILHALAVAQAIHPWTLDRSGDVHERHPGGARLDPHGGRA